MVTRPSVDSKALREIAEEFWIMLISDRSCRIWTCQSPWLHEPILNEWMNEWMSPASLLDSPWCRQGYQDKEKMIWGFEVVGQEKNSTTLLRILDFIFTANAQCKNRWLDLSAFVGFQAPSPPPRAAHPAVAWRCWRPLFSLMWLLTAEILKHWKTGFIMEMLTDY